MLKDRVTVIVPCYNVEEYIQECLDSIKGQGGYVSKVYCVDNGSTDGTLNAIHTWMERNPDVPLEVRYEKVKGAAAARNNPLHEVGTEWVQFLDADDLLLPVKLEEQVAQGANCDVIYDTYVYRQISGKEVDRKTEKVLELALVNGGLGNTCTNLWRTEKLKEVGGMDPALKSSQEYDLMLRLYEQGARFRRMDTKKTVIRERASGQISQSGGRSRWVNVVKVQERMLAAFRKKDLQPELWNELDHAFFACLRMLYPYDPELALEQHSKYLAPKGFKPRRSPINTTLYILLFRILGFKGAETVKRLKNKLTGTEPTH